MLTEFDFIVIQLRYIKAAMDNIPSYRPDGQTPSQIQGLIGSAGPTRTAYITQKTTLDGARALRRTSVANLHDICVLFGAQARIAYRKNATVSECLERLPTDDRSFGSTLTRADAILAQWAQLPPVNDPPVAFTILQESTTLTLANVTVMRAACETADLDIPVKDQLFQLKEAELHTKQAELADQVTAALAQGRSQFPEGSMERGIIDAIPTESPRNLPGKAVITSATNPIPSSVVLDFECPGATSFDIFMLAPGSPDYVIVAEDIIVRSYEVSGLSPSTPPDQYSFYVRGRNARGFGEDSDVTSLDVT